MVPILDPRIVALAAYLGVIASCPRCLIFTRDSQHAPGTGCPVCGHPLAKLTEGF